MTPVWVWFLLGSIGCRTDPDLDPAPPSRPRPPPPTSGTTAPPPSLSSVDPPIVDPAGGSVLELLGTGLVGASVTVGGVPVDVVTADATRLTVRTRPVPPGDALDVGVTVAGRSAVLSGAVAAWSPAELPGARLFDAAVGVATGPPATHYEWQRLTEEVHPDWRARDGNTLTWLPSTGRFWMVGGWNPLPPPFGFSDVDPAIDPTASTTDEVWSSADGTRWVLERAHGHGAFEPRHAHNTVVWRDELWAVGGDTWQGHHNHDVLRSVDGATWEEVLPPGSPPWTPRSLSITGVHDDRLWTGFGQELFGDPADYTHHNDLWVSDDGQRWTQVAADGPASDTRPGPCGLVSGFVSFRGELWLVGCAQYDEVSGHELIAEVWSTGDGVTWTRRADPPWVGKAWADVAVWRDRLWVLFGYTTGDPANGWPAGNATEVWSSADGETWTALPADGPAPGSHAQGVAVHDDYLLYAGGNYTFGIGLGLDLSAWRLVPFDGDAVTGWSARDAVGAATTFEVAPAEPAEQPVWVADAFGPGVPGLQLDGSDDVLRLAAPAESPGGHTAMWVARAPWLPGLYGWDETYAPVGTVVGGLDETGLPSANVGYTDGALVLVNRRDAPGELGEVLYERVPFGDGLQDGPGEARLVGVTVGADGAAVGYADGVPIGTGSVDVGSPRTWSAIGSGMEGAYYGPNSRFGGALGAVLVVPGALDADTVARVHAWARGRFGVR